VALASWTQEQILAQLDTGYHWSGSTITYAFPTTSSGIYGSSELSGFQGLNATQQAAATLALQTWDDLIAPDFLKVSSGASNIEYGTSTTGIGYAHAYLPTTGSVWFNRAYADLMAPQVGAHSFLTYIHETGHALGLDHMGDYNGSGTWTPSSYQDSGVYSVMSYFGPNWGSGSSSGVGLVAWADWIGADGRLYSPQTPMLNDIMALQAMYGAETTTRTGNTTYGFNSTDFGTLSAIYNFAVNLHPILTIYDSEGTDTLDLSGWSTSSTIDLAPGAYSSCNSMTNNIAIAYTCSIENAVGGAGADTISGNTLNNSLDGGMGNDSLSGGGGDDVLVAGSGNDLLYGGTGNDTVVFSGAFSEYSFSYIVSQGFTFVGSATGSDIVKDVETFVFSNVTKTAGELSDGAGVALDPVTVSIAASAPSVLEGNSGSTAYVFNVSLSAAGSTTQTVNWRVAGSGASAATAADFTGVTTGSVTFQAGETTKAIQVLIAGDTQVETDEGLTVSLTSPSSGLILGTSSATGTIRNDDIVVVPDDYTMTTATRGLVTVGGSAVSGVIETASDGDLFKVSLTAGYTYVFNLKRVGGALDPYLELYGSTLTAITQNDDASASITDSQIIYTATVSGTHYLAAKGDALSTGSYSISAIPCTGLTLNGDDSANTLNGSSGIDRLYGLGGNDTLNAGLGNDLLDGGAGADQMLGGSGNDVYLVDDSGDVVTESSTTGGTDLVRASASWAMSANVENLQLEGTADLMGTGNTLANSITGNSGNNVLNGQAGIDTMNGGEGSDIYLIGAASEHAAAEISDSGSTGVDEVRFAATSAGTLKLFAGDRGIEQVVLGTGTAAVATTTGTTALNVDASALTKAITLVGNDGANILTGTAYADRIKGGGGVDVLNGLAGVDSMDGGEGSDIYLIGLASEHLAAEISDSGSAGVDEVRFAATSAATLKLYAGDSGVERVVLGTGTGAAATTTGTAALNVDASALANGVAMVGNAGANVLTGTAYADQIDGGSGDDILSGGDGVDSMNGGAGSDLYLIALASEHVSTEINDTGGSGVDELRFTASSASTLTLFANDKGIERVVLGTGTGAVATTTGTAALNVNAAAVAKAITLLGNAGANVLTGSAYADRIEAGGGADLLIGGVGTDIMNGGEGSDLYLIALTSDHLAAEIADTGSAGVDEVRFTATSAGTLKLYAGDTGLERVVLGTGSDALADTTGTAALNVDASAVLKGITLVGNAGANILTGTTYGDRIEGGDGADLLKGLAGTDSMNGGEGSDLYLIARASEHTAAEFADTGSTGIDEVRFADTTAGTLKLYAGDSGIERVVLGTGTGAVATTTGTVALNVDALAVGNAITLVGNAGANLLTGTAYADQIDGGNGADRIVGGSGNDTLNGGQGNDSLTGGDGADAFVFNTAPNAASNKDTLIDFQAGTDHIDFSLLLFPALGGSTGDLGVEQFWAAAGAIKGHDADDRIVYNTTSGSLYYDADGSGSGAAVEIALVGISTHPTLDHGDFHLIA
jgi:serralysin